MRYIYVIILIFIFSSFCAKAQELNAKLTINSSKVQSVDKQLVAEMETAVRQMFNDQNWSNTAFEKDELIDCTVGITLNTMPSENNFGAEINITSRRPVYNSSYITPLINYRDSKFDINYAFGQTLSYNELSLDNNIVAVVAFYANIILGLDFDSFSLNGGRAYFAKAMDIANMAQNMGARGWEPFDGKSRYDLALALTEDNSKNFHSLWYNYHRLGLDEMAGNASRGRIRIIESLKDLEALQAARPNSLLVALFGDTKLDEFVKICGKASTEDKRDIKERLKKLFPSKRAMIDGMK